MIRRIPSRSRAPAVLLLFALLLTSSCAQIPGQEERAASPNTTVPKTIVAEETQERTEAAVQGRTGPQESTGSRTGTPNNVRASEDRTPEAQTVHRATDENSRGDYTYLDLPEINGEADAVVFVTPPEDYGHNIGVWYEPVKQRWAIFNQDIAPVTAGKTFEVVVPDESERLVHRAKKENTSGDTTYIDSPLINGKPGAEVSVTQNWNPGGGNGVYNDHPVGVRYDAERGLWAVFNGDRKEIPEGAAFNVTISEQANTTGDKVATIDTGEAPEYRDFYSEGNPKTPQKFVSSGSSAGAIPVVRPFNFGQDPGGPEDKTLTIDIPKIGVDGVPVFDTISEEKLRDGTVHIPATGYPWQKGANVYIAGHRIGFSGTPSYYVFYRLDELTEGDEILLTDAAGGEYVYRVTKQEIVGPNSVDVMNAVEGESLITLQTCTLPDYEERLIVQGRLVTKPA